MNHSLFPLGNVIFFKSEETSKITKKKQNKNKNKKKVAIKKHLQLYYSLTCIEQRMIT